MKITLVFGALLASSLAGANAQMKRTVTPLGDTLTKAMNKASLTAPGSQPFHLRIVVSEPENPQSPYQGTIEEWWASPEQWRRETTDKDGLHQTIVVTNGETTEKDEGDYFPLWLRSFVVGAFDLVPNLAQWQASGLQIEQITMPNGDKSTACVKSQGHIGVAEHASTSYSNLCFDAEGRLDFYGSPRYSMEFHDYRGFGEKQFPRHFGDSPEPGTNLLGNVTVLEDLSKVKDSTALFTPLAENDHRFETVGVSSVQMESLSSGNGSIVWPSVHSGNIHGHIAMYVSADTSGRVREAWPLASDNAGLEDPARDQVRQWRFKLAKDKDGKPVQVDGGLSFSFDTVIGDPLPELTDAEVRALAIHPVEPSWPAGLMKSGDFIDVPVSVNERGELTGSGFSKAPVAAQGAVMNAVRQWSFQPLIRDGKPQYFHGTLRFVVP